MALSRNLISAVIAEHEKVRLYNSKFENFKGTTQLVDICNIPQLFLPRKRKISAKLGGGSASAN
jgi:hypothetical protein